MLSRSSLKTTVSEVTVQIPGGSPGFGPLFKCTTRTFSLWVVVVDVEVVVLLDPGVITSMAVVLELSFGWRGRFPCWVLVLLLRVLLLGVRLRL